MYRRVSTVRSIEYRMYSCRRDFRVSAFGAAHAMAARLRARTAPRFAARSGRAQRQRQPVHAREISPLPQKRKTPHVQNTQEQYGFTHTGHTHTHKRQGIKGQHTHTMCYACVRTLTSSISLQVHSAHLAGASLRQCGVGQASRPVRGGVAR